jgi:hypothetical protein
MPSGPYALTLFNSAVTNASAPNDLMQFVTAASVNYNAAQFLEFRIGIEGSVTSTMCSIQLNYLSTAATTGTAMGTTYSRAPNTPVSTLQSGAALSGTLMTVAGTILTTPVGVFVGPVSFNILMGYLWQPPIEGRMWLAGGGAVSVGTASLRVPRGPNPSSTLNYDVNVQWLEF